MPRSGKPISDQLKRAIAKQRESAKRVRKLRQAQAEYDRQVLADFGLARLTEAAASPDNVEKFRTAFLADDSPIADKRIRQRLGELLIEHGADQEAPE